MWRFKFYMFLSVFISCSCFFLFDFVGVLSLLLLFICLFVFIVFISSYYMIHSFVRLFVHSSFHINTRTPHMWMCCISIVLPFMVLWIVCALAYNWICHMKVIFISGHLSRPNRPRRRGAQWCYRLWLLTPWRVFSVIMMMVMVVSCTRCPRILALLWHLISFHVFARCCCCSFLSNSDLKS